MKKPSAVLLVLALLPACRAGAEVTLEQAGRAAAAFLQSNPLAPGGAAVGAVRAMVELQTVAQVKGAPVAQAGGLTEGPEAALAFERSLRGLPNPKAREPYYNYPKKDHRYPQAQPADLDVLRNIIKMRPGLSTPEELTRDFLRNKTAEQKAILVLVKTEFCHSNAWRLCSVTTAALEKRSTPLLRQFRVYAAWVKGNDEPQGPRNWEQDVMSRYEFEQGPGATLVGFLPGQKDMFRTDAREMELWVEKFEQAGGRTPKLEQFLKYVLDRVPARPGAAR